MNLSGFQRLNLFSRPTPLNELTGLQKELACKPRIFMKRDDLTQLGPVSYTHLDVYKRQMFVQQHKLFHRIF